MNFSISFLHFSKEVLKCLRKEPRSNTICFKVRRNRAIL